MSNPPTVLLGVTGSIAAYKAAELLRMMQRRGWDVWVVMTRGATQFVTELTFRTLSKHPVGVEMFAGPEDWVPEHVALADRADALVIAPCTANVMAKVAHGIADDLLTATALTCKAPLVIAPAMNVHMWENPATQDNARLLESRGVTLVDVRDGDLACGYQGKGCLAEPELILDAVSRKLKENEK
jgi:phosphopantothenoylcysteine decarboxylase / phosphopantothenate---cysteine ligase